MNKETEKLIDNLIRDISRVDFMTKSEARRRIKDLLKAQRENMIKVIDDKLTILHSSTDIQSKNPHYCRGVTDGWTMMAEEIIKALKENE